MTLFTAFCMPCVHFLLAFSASFSFSISHLIESLRIFKPQHQCENKELANDCGAALLETLAIPIIETQCHCSVVCLSVCSLCLPH